jgi:hypothetical protein
MPAKFHELADYNGEVSRGIVHTPAHMRRMAELQTEYNQWALDWATSQGMRTVVVES